MYPLYGVCKELSERSALIYRIYMRKFRTVVSVIIMILAGIVGFFMGSFLENSLAGAILFSMIAGIACIIFTLDNREE